MKNRKERHHHFAVLRLFIFVLFLVSFAISLITWLVVYLLVYTGVLAFATESIPTAGNLFLFFMLLNIPISIGICALGSQFILKPIRELIEGMNHLSRGEFATRVKIGRLAQHYPAMGEMAGCFNRMAEQLESTEMLRSDFINNFSHEFKTPIVSIAGFAQLLQYGDLSMEQQKEYLTIITEESRRLSNMATNVLDLTKVENQTILTDITGFNLSEQIRSCILLLEDKWSKRDIDLQLDFEEFHIHADKSLLKQVWINLLDNAIKFTPEGGIIQIQILPREKTLEVRLRNTGSQIPQECMNKIFNKFYQADESHSSQGNGVGLAIVKRVVQLHGGNVRAESENMVTTFVVELPVNPIQNLQKNKNKA